jgi:phosphoribosylglycinamide formyltransferase-1
MRLGVLCSGGGSNLQSILDAVASGALTAEIALVLSNVPGAGAIARAEKAGVPTKTLDHKAFKGNREGFDAEVVAALRAARVDLVVLAGFMRIVTPVLLNAYAGKVVNIHPALLPAFPGVDGQGQAFRYGVRIAGCTVHFVDGGCDTGPIIAQTAVLVHADDTDATLRQRILKEEHALFPKVLQWIVEGKVRLEADATGRPRVHVTGETTGFFAG